MSKFRRCADRRIDQLAEFGNSSGKGDEIRPFRSAHVQLSTKGFFKPMMAAIVAATLALVAVSPVAAQDSDDARIHLIHGIPDTDVDVIVDGKAVFEDFSFSDTQDLSGLAGETLKGLEVRLAGTETVAIDAGDIELPAEGNITAVAHLDAEGTPSLAVFENDVSKIEAGEGRLVVRHAAAAPSVDIKADGEVAFEAVENGKEGSADLPVGSLSAEVVPTGEAEPVVIGPADLPIADGSSLIVYAVGSLEDKNLSVLTETIDGLGTNPTTVNTGNSPIESPVSSGLLFAFALMATLALVAGGFSIRWATYRS